MVRKLHILLTYNCTLRCKHCYVFSDQRAPGKISLSQVSHFLNDGQKLGSLEWVYFGGGEPFTQYPMLLKAVQRARKLGYRVGVETNGYFARTEEAALRLLRPLANLGIEDLRVSNDSLHYQKPETSPALRALTSAGKLGIPTTLVHINLTSQDDLTPATEVNVDRVERPRFMYTGRAAESFSETDPGMDVIDLSSCPRGDLAAPDKVFVDAYGFVQICPGIAIGNACQDPLNEIITNYDLESHPVLSILHKSGPMGLIQGSDLHPEEKFIDTCHGCYSSRKHLIDRYPEQLGPRHVYGF